MNLISIHLIFQLDIQSKEYGEKKRVWQTICVSLFHTFCLIQISHIPLIQCRILYFFVDNCRYLQIQITCSQGILPVRVLFTIFRLKTLYSSTVYLHCYFILNDFSFFFERNKLRLDSVLNTANQNAVNIATLNTIYNK